MATITIEGRTIHYDVWGNGPPLVITPGGRFGGAVDRPTARVLADRCQVVTWDRPNNGSSDLYLGGERTELEVQADTLAELVRQLGMAPAYLAGGCAGCRVSLVTAVRHPEVVRGLLLYEVGGGHQYCQNMGYTYHVPYIQAAEKGGMEAVAETPFYAERIAKNPENRGRLLTMDPKEFIRTMYRWNETFYYRLEVPTPGCTEEDLRSMQAPTLLFHNHDDDPTHPREVSDRVAALLPNVVERAELPWSYEEWTDVLNGKVPGATAARTLLPRLAGPFGDFIARMEARRQATAVERPV